MSAIFNRIPIKQLTKVTLQDWDPASRIIRAVVDGDPIRIPVCNTLDINDGDLVFDPNIPLYCRIDYLPSLSASLHQWAVHDGRVRGIRGFQYQRPTIDHFGLSLLRSLSPKADVQLKRYAEFANSDQSRMTWTVANPLDCTRPAINVSLMRKGPHLTFSVRIAERIICLSDRKGGDVLVDYEIPETVLIASYGVPISAIIDHPSLAGDQFEIAGISSAFGSGVKFQIVAREVDLKTEYSIQAH